MNSQDSFALDSPSVEVLYRFRQDRTLTCKCSSHITSFSKARLRTQMCQAAAAYRREKRGVAGSGILTPLEKEIIECEVRRRGDLWPGFLCFRDRRATLPNMFSS